MPWQHCDNWYNTQDCISMDEIKKLKCDQNHLKAIHLTINQSLPLKQLLKSNSSAEQSLDIALICQRLSNRTSPTEEFFKYSFFHLFIS